MQKVLSGEASYSDDLVIRITYNGEHEVQRLDLCYKRNKSARNVGVEVKNFLLLSDSGLIADFQKYIHGMFFYDGLATKSDSVRRQCIDAS